MRRFLVIFLTLATLAGTVSAQQLATLLADNIAVDPRGRITASGQCRGVL